MKAGQKHEVPLTEPALAVLRLAADLRTDKAPTAFVFPGGTKGKGTAGLSNVAMLALLRRMEHGEITMHGFRSSFRDWAAEETTHERAVIEKSLAHTLENKVEAAYQRSDLLKKRRKLMEDWAAFCGRVVPDENVVQLHAVGA